MLGSKAALIQLMAQVGHFLCLLYLIRLKQTMPLDWLVRVHVEVSSVSSCPYGYSFVPAESATLGIVDKSAFQHAICSNCATLIYIVPSYHPRSNPRFGLQSNLAIELFVFARTTVLTMIMACLSPRRRFIPRYNRLL